MVGPRILVFRFSPPELAVLDGARHEAIGKPVRASVWVRFEDSRSGSPIHSTDDDGCFRIDVTAGFRGSIGAAMPDDWMRQAQLDGVLAGQTEVQIVIKPMR